MLDFAHVVRILRKKARGAYVKKATLISGHNYRRPGPQRVHCDWFDKERDTGFSTEDLPWYLSRFTSTPKTGRLNPKQRFEVKENH